MWRSSRGSGPNSAVKAGGAEESVFVLSRETLFAHLQCAVLYVLDISEQCGFSIAQLRDGGCLTSAAVAQLLDAGFAVEELRKAGKALGRRKVQRTSKLTSITRRETLDSLEARPESARFVAWPRGRTRRVRRRCRGWW